MKIQGKTPQQLADLAVGSVALVGLAAESIALVDLSVESVALVDLAVQSVALDGSALEMVALVGLAVESVAATFCHGFIISFFSMSDFEIIQDSTLFQVLLICNLSSFFHFLINRSSANFSSNTFLC